MTATKIAIPTVLVLLAVVFALKVMGMRTAAADSPAPEAAATPYSADHARISEGSPQAPAPTF
jgi:hypothetical protein